ncbi:MAG: hypothetical protein IIY37_03505, partial [Selenomonadaceae bacterium]|nr:hypothetical protein [Selenomonadaceae bacterium]
MNINLENILQNDAFGATTVTRLKTASDSTESFKEMFSSLLQEKRDSLQETLEELEERRQEIKELEDAQKAMEVEVIRRIMPDGRILVTE